MFFKKIVWKTNALSNSAKLLGNSSYDKTTELSKLGKLIGTSSEQVRVNPVKLEIVYKK